MGQKQQNFGRKQRDMDGWIDSHADSCTAI